MTLNTKVAIKTTASGWDVFELALAALCDADGGEWWSKDVIVTRHSEGEHPEWIKDLDFKEPHFTEMFRYRHDQFSTRIGQGLPGVVQVDFKNNGDVFSFVNAEDPTQTTFRDRTCTHLIAWDTAYAYNKIIGGRVHLHASALMTLSRSLPEGSELYWNNEYTGEWHEGVLSSAINDFVRNKPTKDFEKRVAAFFGKGDQLTS